MNPRYIREKEIFQEVLSEVIENGGIYEIVVDPHPCTVDLSDPEISYNIETRKVTIKDKKGGKLESILKNDELKGINPEEYRVKDTRINNGIISIYLIPRTEKA